MDQDHPELQQAVLAISAGDFARSFAIVERLAQQGLALAQHFLGWHYHKGIGAEQNDAEAVNWWRKAADNGIVESQQGLGWAYEHGRGVDQDYQQAYRWYSLAARAGDEEAQQGLSNIAGKLTPEQIRALEQKLAADR